MNRFTKPLASRALWLLIPFAVCAHATQNYSGRSHLIDPADHGITSGAHSSALAGSFLEVGTQDAAFLNDGALVVCYQPGVYSQLVGGTSAVGDLAMRSGDSDVDRLYGVINERLTRFDFGAGDGGWSEALVGNVLPGVELVVSADLDGDDHDDLITLATDGVTVRGYLFPSASSDVCSLDFTLSLPTTAAEIAGLDWDGDGIAEVAVLTSNFVYVYSQAGTQLAMYFTFVGSSDLTPFRNAGEVTDRVAWATPSMQGEDWILVGWEGGGQEGPYQLGNFEVGAMRAADFSGDGLTDLVVTAESAEEIWMLAQHDNWDNGGIDSFSASNQDNLTLELPEAKNSNERSCAAAFADFDGDGDGDLLQADDRGERVAVFKGERYDELVLMPQVSGPIDFCGHLGLEDRIVHITLADPQVHSFPPGFDAPDDLQVEVLWQAPGSAVLVPYTSGSGIYDFAETVSIPLPDLLKDNSGIFVIDMRFRELAGTDPLVYPASLLGITYESSVATFWEMTESEFQKLEICAFPGGGAGGGGGMLTLPAFPAPGIKPIEGSGGVPLPVTPPFPAPGSGT